MANKRTPKGTKPAEKKAETPGIKEVEGTLEPEPDNKHDLGETVKIKTSKEIVGEAVEYLDVALSNIEQAIKMFRSEAQSITRLVNARGHLTEVRKYLAPYLQ